MKKIILATLVASVISSAQAGTYFEPLSEPNQNKTETTLNTAPFTLPPNYSQTFVQSRKTMNDYLTSQGSSFPATFGNWDMMDFGGNNNEFVFIPHEVNGGAGLTRLNRDTGEIVILLQGNDSGVADMDPTDGWNHQDDDFTGMDPAVITPAGTLVVGEEWGFAGGRLFELSNPTTATSPADAQWRWLSGVPSVSHEGIKFDKDGNMYFVDENSSGSIYKFEPKEDNDYSIGSTSVLVVGAGGVDHATGAATWVAITDEDGKSLTTANPFDFTNRGGRAAADEVGGTGYCRPEDLAMGTLPGKHDDNEVLYVAATCANIVYSIEFINEEKAMVREFVNANVTPDLIGNNPVGTGNPKDSTYGLDDPDNLALDAAGNVFIIEDEHPGDIWQAVDVDKDGVAEHVALFASLGDYNSEPTGFKVDPRDPYTWYVNIQHPCDFGCNDALWVIKHDVADSCSCEASASHGKYVSCIAGAAKELGIMGSMKAALIEVAVSSSCGLNN